VLAVVKNNGYGLGHLNAARALEPESQVSGFAVVKLSEAMALRDGGIRKPVLWMGPVDEASLREAIAKDITPMIYTPVGPLLAKIAGERGQPVTIQVHVDTGLGREGIPYRAAAPLLDDLLGQPGVQIAGVMTVFSEDPDLDREQVKRLTELLEPYARRGARLGRRHAASSMALFGDSSGFFDQVRPGLALWGVYSELRLRQLGALELKPAGALRARVAYVKRLEAGESAGYERAFTAREPTWVATVPMGHVDGVPRVAVKGASMRLAGRLSPIVAVSASHTIVALGSEATCQPGDVATLFDWQEGSRPEDIGAACGASHYDLMMHLDSSLPRRVLTG
jgi:alanine racemase